MIYFSDFGAGGGGGGGITFVGAKTFGHAGASTTTALTDLKDTDGNNATLQEDDVVIIALNRGGTSDFTQAQLTCQDPGAADYQLPHTDLYANGVSNDTNLQVQYKVMGASPDTAVTVPAASAGQTIAMTITALRGVDTATVFEALTTATGTGTGQADPPSVLPLTAGAWVMEFMGAATGQNAPWTAPSTGFSTTTNHFLSLRFNGSSADGVIGYGLKVDWTSGAVDPDVPAGGPTSANDSWAAVTAAVKPA